MSGSCVNHSSHQTEAEIMGITYFLLPPPDNSHVLGRYRKFWTPKLLGMDCGSPLLRARGLFSGFKEMLNISHDDWELGWRVGSVSSYLSVIIPVYRRLLSKEKNSAIFQVNWLLVKNCTSPISNSPNISYLFEAETYKINYILIGSDLTNSYYSRLVLLVYWRKNDTLKVKKLY